MGATQRIATAFVAVPRPEHPDRDNFRHTDTQSW
jgi:hypothetical protein